MSEGGWRLWSLLPLACCLLAGRPAGGAGEGSRRREEAAAAWARPDRGEKSVPYVILGDGERRRLTTMPQGVPPVRLQCEIRAGGRRLRLDLERNENLLPSAHSLMFYLPNGTLMTSEEASPVNCFYHGRVRGFPNSWVSVSTCSGLRGLLALTPHRSYGIEPVSGDPRGVHLISHLEGDHSTHRRCAVDNRTQYPDTSTDQGARQRRRRDILTESKYVELVMVADRKEFRRYGDDWKMVQLRMLEIANQVDAFYRPLGIRVALVGVEIWSQENPFEISSSPGETLDRFLEWRETHLVPRIPHDNAQLLIGGSFPGGAVGMASQNSMCSKDRSGGVIVDHSVSILAVASTIAHELGHNLGLSHDSESRRCICPAPPRLGGCIMELATGFLSGQAFSSCSWDDLDGSLSQGGATCLFNFPAAGRLIGGQRCGNLFLEEGEECDCGLADECGDPCCNATSCRLMPGAQCSSNGACCEGCKVKRAATLCRPALGDCDLPEFCTGSSPHCPSNVFLRNGLPCHGSQAYCYNGACLTLEAQCEALWGPGTVQAPDACFAVNKKGNTFGNCGLLPNGTFLRCTQGDVKCGRIHCHVNSSKMVQGPESKKLVTQLGQGPGEPSCRGIHYSASKDVTDAGMVMSGTMCGPGKVCVDRKCQNVSVLGVEDCLTKCHQHGVCNSNNNCHCDEGWAPPDCRRSGSGGSIDSGPTQEPPAVISAHLVALTLSLILLAISVVLCYWKRDAVRRELWRLWGGPRRHRNSRVENGNRLPAVDRMRYKPPDRLQREMVPAHTFKTTQQVAGRPPAPPLTKALPRDLALKSNQPLVPRNPAPPQRPLPRDPVLRPVTGWSPALLEAGCVPDHCGPPTRPPPPPPYKQFRLSTPASASS
ncbi:disintegrin and metalloproteinase domain-containing protein 15 isoform X2 [Narcine bancroftii]|uniref:disintegrin and metalloproteinase domain-containing protein 15 isoform X2 n=1 Tax=Narcine bancroftii TaxID=1343680 RepID=UPI0038314A74